VLGREGPSRGDALNVGEQEAGESQLQDSLHVLHCDSGDAELGKSNRYGTDDLDTVVRQTEERNQGRGEDHHQQRERTSRVETVSCKKYGERAGADQKNGRPGIPQLPKEQDAALEEMIASTRDSEQLGQLRYRDAHCRAGLEADQDGFGDEVDKRAEPQRPGEKAEQGNQTGRRRGDGGVERGVSARHGSHDAGNHHRDGRGGTDRQVAGRGEERIDDAAADVAVKTDLGGEPGEDRVGHRHRNGIRGQGDPGKDVVQKPRRTVLG
jgi:hypothetical protein